MGNMDEMCEALKTLAKATAEMGKAMSEATHAMREAADEAAREIQKARQEFLRALNDAYKADHPEIMDELADYAVDPEEMPRKPERPRPPKYAGPQNKGRAWNRQPPRLARSYCRKVRR